MSDSYILVKGSPVIDLARISSGDELLPVVKAILAAQHDTFLLRNYANIDTVNTLRAELTSLDQANNDNDDNNDNNSSLSPGFDENFTGKWSVGNTAYVEQYIVPTKDGLPSITTPQLRKLYNLLLKVAEFFADICVKAKSELDSSLSSSSQNQKEGLLLRENTVKLTRYYRMYEKSQYDGIDGAEYADLSPTTFLPNGDQIESVILHDYSPHRVPGYLSVFASGEGLQYKPVYGSGSGNGDWCSIPDELQDCLVLHLGSIVRGRSSKHTTTLSPTLRVDLQAGNVIELNLLASLESSDNADELLGMLMEEFPQVAEKFYPRELRLSRLHNRVEFFKRMFAAFEAVVSLNLVTTGVGGFGSSGSRLSLDKLLPQVTNMLKDRRVTENDFFRMLYVWPDSYHVQRNPLFHRVSKSTWAISLPPVLSPLSKDGVGSKSRKLQFSQLADSWYESVSNVSGPISNIPKDVPLLKLTNHKVEDSPKDSENSGLSQTNRIDLNSNPNKTKSKNYLFNEKEQFLFKERKTDTQENLLNRIRAKERRQNEMLAERELRYQHFLDIKIEEVFNILRALEEDKPYTETYICSLIVESLLDSNNPIGYDEASKVLDKLYSLLSDDMVLHRVVGGLKVYRWRKLDIEKFRRCMAKHIAESELMEAD